MSETQREQLEALKRLENLYANGEISDNSFTKQAQDLRDNQI